MIDYVTEQKVIRFAKRSHRDQFDKAGAPYIDHLEMVADIVTRVTHDSTIVTAAWLHDILEDTAATREMLIGLYVPEEIVHAVELLTRTPAQDYDDYIEALSHSTIARSVKMADLVHNMDTRRFPAKTIPTAYDLKRVAKYRRSFHMLAKNGQEEALYYQAYDQLLKNKIGDDSRNGLK